MIAKEKENFMGQIEWELRLASFYKCFYLILNHCLTNIIDVSAYALECSGSEQQ